MSSDVLRENTIGPKTGRNVVVNTNHVTPPFIHYANSVIIQKSSEIKLQSLLWIVEIVQTIILLLLHNSLLSLLFDWYALCEILAKSDAYIVSFGVLQTRQHTFHLGSQQSLDERWLERILVAVELAPSFVQSNHYLLWNKTTFLLVVYNTPLQVLPHEGLDLLRIRFHLLIALLRISWMDESLCGAKWILSGQRHSLEWVRLFFS